MLDRMYKEHPRGEAPEPLERLAHKIRDADGFVFVVGEYNWGVQAWTEEPHRSFPRRMVLASRDDRELFGWGESLPINFGYLGPLNLWPKRASREQSHYCCKAAHYERRIKQLRNRT